MGLISFILTGTAFILIGTLESLRSSQSNKLTKNPSPLYITLSIFSSLIIITSLISIFNAHTSNDAVGIALQLQILPIALLFLIFSLISLTLHNLPSLLLNLVITFGFAEEFLLFYLQRKDPSGVENRYYDLLLVPITICVFSTVLELGCESNELNFSKLKLGRGIGLILQGTWFIQMGLSLFSKFVAEGCDLHLISNGNYSLRCKGHSEFHRARAIATLQFNCHLAFMVIVLVGFYSFTCGKNEILVKNSTKYTPLGGEMQSFESSAGNFTLDSDDEEIKDGNVGSQKGINGINGNVSHH